MWLRLNPQQIQNFTQGDAFLFLYSVCFSTSLKWAADKQRRLLCSMALRRVIWYAFSGQWKGGQLLRKATSCTKTIGNVGYHLNAFFTFRRIALKFSLILISYGCSTYFFFFFKVVRSSGHVCDKCFDPLITHLTKNFGNRYCSSEKELAVEWKISLPIAVVMGSSNKEEGEGQRLLRTVRSGLGCWEREFPDSKHWNKGKVHVLAGFNPGEYNWKLTQLQWKQDLRNESASPKQIPEEKQPCFKA